MEFESLADLLDLQEVDSQIDRLLHQRETLPELGTWKAAQQEASDLATRLADLEGDLRRVHLDRDKAEGELSILEDRLRYHEKRLYAGGMSARETETLRQEVEALRTQQGRMEERVLGLLDQEDTLEPPVGMNRSAHQDAATRLADQERLVQVRLGEIDAEIGRREARKAEIVPLIDPELLSLYERLRRTKDGVAVGRLVEGVCGGCHLALSATERAEALGSNPPRCIHCRRILVP